MEIDVKLKNVKTDNLRFLANKSWMNDQIGVQDTILQALQWYRELPEEERPDKCLLLFLRTKDGSYDPNYFMSNMRTSEAVALLATIRHWFERILLGN